MHEHAGHWPLASLRALFLACLMLHAGAAHAQEASPSPAKALPQEATPRVSIDALLRAFSQMPGLEATFVEEKHISMLAAPLISRGVLFFAHPGHLLRRVTEPRPSEVLITPKALRATDANGEKIIDLAARPDFKPFVESLVWILAGDRESLERVYELSFVPATGSAPWQLTLTPKGAPLNQLIDHIRIRGDGRVVQEVEVLESIGNRTLTRIVKADPAREFSARERARLFGQAPPP